MQLAESKTVSNIKLGICVIGIYLSYFMYGIFQEKVSKVAYDGEKFSYTFALLFLQCLSNACMAVIASFLLPASLHSRTMPRLSIILAAAPYLAAMLCSNYALKFVDYPTQVLAKSVKPIAMMIAGIVSCTKSYPVRKWVSVVMLCAGIATFFTAMDTSKKGAKESTTTGILLLCGSLALDGFYGTIQDQFKKRYTPSPIFMMMFMNIWAVILVAPIVVYTDQGLAAAQFVERHPEILQPILGFSLLSAIGQLFVYYTVFTYGSLITSIVTTSRKFFTILLSVLYFGNSVNDTQWIGVGIVFFGLFSDMYLSSREQSSKNKKKE